MKTKVSLAAVAARINRKLRLQDQVLRTARGARCRFELGSHCVLNTRYNCVASEHVSPVVLARRLSVLRPGEIVDFTP